MYNVGQTISIAQTRTLGGPLDLINDNAIKIISGPHAQPTALKDTQIYTMQESLQRYRMDDFTKRDDVVKYVAIVVKTSNAETKQALFIIGKQCQKQEHENTLGIVVFGMPLGIVLVAL